MRKKISQSDDLVPRSIAALNDDEGRNPRLTEAERRVGDAGTFRGLGMNV